MARTVLLLCRPFLTKRLSLFQNRLRSLFLLVGRITILSKNPLDDYANLGAGVFAPGPVDGHAAFEPFNQFLSDKFQYIVTQYLNGTVVNSTRTSTIRIPDSDC